MSREPKRLGGLATFVMTLLILAIIAATGYVVWLCVDMVNQDNAPTVPQQPSIVLPTEDPAVTEAPTETTVPPTTQAPVEPETVIATTTIASQGDLLMHEPVFRTCKQSDGSYDFESIFRYTRDLISSYDYALANLETTLNGADKHQPNMAFSCPIELAQSAVDAGYDMFLTVNNHCGDTMAEGLERTLREARDVGLATLGTQLEGEKRYSVVDVGGIQVGMVAYSWAFSFDGTKVSMNGLNGIPVNGRINFFRNSNLDAFYKEAEQIMADMKADGAEVTMMQIHWGNEYELKENATQNKIAQKLCDLGFDVIVGGHPHVVQPMELLTSTLDESHSTVCIYSLGNAVSNQRRGYSTQFPPNGHSEDGAIFTVSFEKYSDGKVYVSAADVIPTWVNMHTTDGVKEYNILPLTDSTREQWRDLYKLNDNTLPLAEKSYDRTMAIIGEGLEQCQSHLEQAKLDREQYYYDLAYGGNAA